MLGTIGLELTSLINSDLAWNKVSKGNRSSSRRARKSLELRLRNSGEVVNKEVDMPVSESEKLGVTVLGCRFSEKAEHVPIKKRRFLFRTPSPPPRTLSPHLEETETIVKREHVPAQGFRQNLTVECQLSNSNGAASADLGQIVDSEFNIYGKNLVKIDEHRDEKEDFSGISILAAAACSNSMGGYVEEGSGVEESFGHKATPQEPMNVEAKDELVTSAEMSTEGTGSCVSPTPAEEGHASSRTEYFSSEDLPLKNMKDGTSLQESALAASFSNKDDAKIRAQESSARDDRLHWDLNTIMDAWEQPFDCEHVDSPANVAHGISEHADDTEHSDGNKSLEGHEFQTVPEDISDNTGNALCTGELRRLAIETQELNIEEDRLDSSIDNNRAICCQVKMVASKIDHARDVVMDPEKNKESSHNQEKIDPNLGSGGSVPAKYASQPSASNIVDENASANWLQSGTTLNTESLSSHWVASLDSPVEYSLPPDSGNLTSAHVQENHNATSPNAVSLKSMEDCASDPQTGRTIFFSSLAEKQNDTFPNIVLLDKATCDIRNASNGDGVDTWRSSEVLGDVHDVKNMACMETVRGPIDDGRESAACESDERGSSHSHHANLVALTSGAFLGGQHVAPVETTVQHCENFLVQNNAETDTQAHIDAKEPAVMSPGKSTVLSEQPCGRSSLDACRNFHDEVSHGKVALEKPLEDSNDTDVCQGDRGIVVGIEKSSDLQVDYDSQYEDGELRDSSVHDWEEYDGDYEETECVDYGSDNRDINNAGSENTEESNFEAHLGSTSRTKVNYAGSSGERAIRTSSPCLRVQNSEKVDRYDKGSESGHDQRTSDDKDNNREDNVEEANQLADLKMETSGWDRLTENCRHTSDMRRVRYGSIRKNFSGDQKDGSDAEDIEMKAFRSRVIRRELLSRIERPASHGVFHRRGRVGIQGSSTNDDDSNPISEREFDTGKSFGRGRYSLQRGGHWADSSSSQRGLKRHYSPTYHGSTSFPRSGPEDVASHSTVRKGVAGSSGQASRQATNASFHGLHRSLRRSGSPNVRQEIFNMHRAIRAAGDMSPDRFMTFGRGRSVRYCPRVHSGAPRGRHHGPVNDNYVESSLNYSHPFTRRRRRSFSPIERRGNHPARRSSSKSPSRSRTRSPNAWESPRGRKVAGNLGFRHRSRSPNFRSGTRMPRVRSPHLRPGFVPDQEIGFMSEARIRDSPPPHSRWIGYKQRSSLLDRKSPGRIGTRRERFDMLDNPRKVKPNEYYRSIHPGKFSELNGVGRGGPRYKGDDDNRGKHCHRYGLGHPVKHYDLEGPVKRFRYDVEDGLGAGLNNRDKEATDFHGRPKAYSRGIDSRIGDVPRRCREERGPVLHRDDRKCNTNSKSFGMRESEEDLGPRRRAS